MRKFGLSYWQAMAVTGSLLRQLEACANDATRRILLGVKPGKRERTK